MPPPSFQTTIFDYLRVVFHRWHWILGMILMSTGTAWVWAEFFAPRKYRSEMTIMVWSRDAIDPGIKRMVEKAPLDRVMNTIRDKLKVDRRLQYLVCNARFAFKEEYFRKQGPADIDGALRRELELFARPRTYRVGPVGMLARIPDILSTRLHLQAVHTMSLGDLPAKLELQALARILCAETLQENPQAELANQVILEMLSDSAGEGEAQEQDGLKDRRVNYLKALRDWYVSARGGSPTASSATMRAAAVDALRERLLKEQAQAGAGQFSPIAKRELLKEMVATERLLDLHLHAAVENLFARPEDARELEWWVSRLKSGLYVGPVYGNLLTLRYESFLYRRASPFDRPDNVIEHIVVRVAQAMVEQEFYVTENRQFLQTHEAIQKTKKKIKEDLDRVNGELYNLKELREIQLSFLRDYPQTRDEELRYPNRVLPNNWDDPFRGLPRHSIHIQRIDEFYGELRLADEEIVGLKTQIEGLRRDIRDPKNQTRRLPKKERVQKDDPPEIVALKRELAVRLVELGKLLERNTDQHPFVVRLNREIAQIKAALDEYRRETSDIEPTVEDEPNPQIAKWKEELQRAERQLETLEAQRSMKLRLIEEEKKKAESAIQKQREYQSLLDSQQRLQERLSNVDAREEELQAKQAVGEDFQVVFAVHTSPRKPGAHTEPKEQLILLMALMVGMLAAGTVVFLLEYTDHSIKTTEDVKRYLNLAVLGTIPEFSFAGIESAQRQSENGILAWRNRRTYPYPLPLDEEAPLPNRERAKVKSRAPIGVQKIVLLIVVAALLLGAYMMPWGRLLDWMRSKVGGSAPASVEPEKTAPAAAVTPETEQGADLPQTPEDNP